MSQRPLAFAKHDRPTEEQRFFSKPDYAFGAGGIYHRERIPVGESGGDGPDLYISTDDRSQMGFAALFAHESIDLKANVGSRLFSSSYIDKFAETLMSVLHDSSSMVLVSE